MLKWFVFGALAAVAVGWVAALVHLSGHAPIGLISIGIGAALGAILGAIAASQRLARRRNLIIGALLLALVTVLTEHAWLYRDFRRQWHAARADSPQVALFRPAEPWSPAEYLRNELTPGRAAIWLIDALLVVAAAVATTIAVRSRLAAPNGAPNSEPFTPTPDT